jgi:hypothetical protein
MSVDRDRVERSGNDNCFYFDSDIFKNTNTVIYFDWKTVCLRLRTMSHTIYAVKFEQTIIHQHVHLRRESQSQSCANEIIPNCLNFQTLNPE